jgi:hypothetical protein
MSREVERNRVRSREAVMCIAPTSIHHNIIGVNMTPFDEVRP